jgi:hypothetical protein
VRIVIRPSGSHPDILTVQDAAEQIRDIFGLADDNPGVAWKLIFATTNTPLTIAAEMVAMTPDMRPDELAAYAFQATQQLDAGFSALREGRIIDAWAEGPKAQILKRVLTRSMNGIGRTDIQINDELEPEVVNPTVAKAGLQALAARAEPEAPPIDRARIEVGSIEGEYLNIGHHYGHPAILVRERKTGGPIWCWVADDDLETISARIRAADVWLRKRVRARGKIIFNSTGDMLHVEAVDVQLSDIERVALDDVRDRSFTDGLTVSEYLERFREGDLG